MNFEQQAGALAEMYTLDAGEVKQAYQNRPDSLSSHFNAASGAEEDKQKYVKHAWVSAIGGCFFPPVWIYTAYAAYKVYENDNKMKEVGGVVRNKVSEFKAKPPAPLNAPV